MKKVITFLLLLVSLYAWCQQTIPKPTPAQIDWQQSEIGFLISYDLGVFDGQKYIQKENRITPIPDYNIFNPSRLNTDQWAAAVKAAGGKFAILTATHETGFALYQSDVNPYCMKALKWKDGKGDVLRDFVNSCRKYGIKPGVYLGIRWNSFLGVHDFKVSGDDQFAKNRQAAYKKMCEGMVEEVTTRYGDLFMVWFDGGASDPTTYGANVLPIVAKNQPGALFYHNAQRADFRWGGSESGTVPYPCWALFPYPYSHSKNTDVIFNDRFKLLKEGYKDGAYYMPTMADAPLRGCKGRHEWFWEPGDEASIYPVNDLVKMYYNSVGHNATLILGLTPDPDGLIPQPDVDTLTAWGNKLKELFSSPIATASGNKNTIEISIPNNKIIKQIMLQEDITQGQRVREFEIQAFVNNKWKTVLTGSSIGYKYIGEIPEAITCKKMKLVVKQAVSQPMIKQFVVY